jgi:hypothetical protein
MAAEYRYSEAIDCVRLCRDATKIRAQLGAVDREDGTL